MIAKTFGIDCSKRCELVIALSYVKAREEMVEIAHRLASDASAAPLELAARLQQLSAKDGDHLANETLRRAGLDIG